VSCLPGKASATVRDILRKAVEIAFARCLKDDLQERVLDFDRDAAHEAERWRPGGSL
jgi:hypothetical protein